MSRGLESDARWWSSWDRLNRQNFGEHPALTSAMVRCLGEFFAPGEIYSATATVAGGDQEIAQLLVEREQTGRWRVFCPSQSPVGTIMFDRAVADGADALRRLLQSLPGIGLALTLPYQDAPISWLSAAQGPSLHRQFIGTTVAIDAAQDFERYWAARPKELRDSVRRRQRMVNEAGLAVRVECVIACAEIGSAVDRYSELESRGWKAKEGTALHPENTQGRFYRRLFESMANTGQAAVWEQYLGDELAASRLVISGPSMDIILKTTFNEDLRRFSPGHLLLVEILNRTMGRRPRRTVELYTKATREWLMWASTERPIETVTVYRHRLIAKAAAWRRERAAATAAPAKAEGESGDAVTVNGRA